jgi:hypothetical protein
VYVVHDNSVHVVYGQGDYTLAQAELTAQPATLPGIVAAYATFVGRIIVQKSAATFTEVASPFTTPLGQSVVTDHNDLSGLQGGTAGEYHHLTAAQATAVANLATTYQPLDADLTAIGALSPANDDIIQRKAGAWTNRTMAQLAADLTTLAPLASPTFTGTPAAPTAAAGTNTTQIATTAFVKAADDLKANLASPTLTGDPKAPTPATSDNDTSIATTAFVQAVKNATLFLLPFSSYNALGSPISASPAFPYAATLPSFTIYPKQWSQGFFIGATNDASNYWTLDLIATISGTDTVIATVTTVGLSTTASAVKTTTTFNPTSLTQAGNIRLAVRATKTGAPSNVSAHGPALEYTLA